MPLDAIFGTSGYILILTEKTKFDWLNDLTELCRNVFRM